MSAAAAEGGEVFLLLEGGDEQALCGMLSGVREPWLARGLVQHHARTGSRRALDLLARGSDLHARYALDALAEMVRGPRPARRAAAAALCRLVARRPAWLHRLPHHPLLRDLLRLLRHETDPPALLDALLALVALLPAAPALVAAHWPELGDAFARLAAWEPPPAPRAHLQLGLYALFHALYATHPCTLLEFLRAEYGRGGGGGGGDVFRHTVLPMLESVRLHPALVTGSRQAEAAPGRWAGHEPHDVLAECRRFALEARREEEEERRPPHTPAPASPPRGSGGLGSRECAALRPGTDAWFPLGDRCGAGAESAPHTPLPLAEGDGSPPEAAVEATPENTPVKEPRAQFQFPGEAGCVRALGGRLSQPPSPLAPAADTHHAARLARVVLERSGAAPASPVPMGGGGAPPPGAERPVPRSAPAPVPPGPAAPSPTQEDREVLQLTGGETPRTPERGGLRMPRGPVLAAARGLTSRLRLYTEAAGADRERERERQGCMSRARSCPALSERAPRVRSVAAQTVDAWPATYEFVLADFYQNLTKKPIKQKGDETRDPYERLERHLAQVYCGSWSPPSPAAGGERERALLEQLALTHAQLVYERWRREVHAERNRRLLGRCRRARSLGQDNEVQRERARLLAAENAELRARLAAARAGSGTGAGAADWARAARLEAALATERAARARAEAALEEARTRRAEEAGAVRALRAEAYELSRQVEGAARARALAERRAGAVRTLRRELLLLGEREARLAEAAAGAAGAHAELAANARLLKQYREELSAARAEAAASGARAEAAAAREAEMEAAAAAREGQLCALRREGRQAADAHAAQLAAVQAKYSALMHVVRRVEAHKLEVLARAPTAGAPAPCAPAPVAPAPPTPSPPALSDLSRCRQVLEECERDGEGQGEGGQH